MWQNPQETADLVTFTEEILKWKLHFLCSVKISNLLFHFSNTYSNTSYETNAEKFYKCVWACQNKQNLFQLLSLVTVARSNS